MKKVNSGTPVSAYMRMIIRQQYTEAAAAIRDLSGSDPVEALHDLRIALRRLRRALVVFKSVLDDEPLRGRCIAALRQFLHEAGRTRDLDVWYEAIRQFERQTALTVDSGWKYFTDAVEATVSEHKTADAISRTSCDELLTLLSSLPGGTDVDAPAVHGGKVLASFAKKQVNRAARNVHAAFGDYHAWSTEEFHRFRRICRNARYVCEFFVPVLRAKKLRTWVSRFKSIAENLGNIHDIDISLTEPGDIALPPVYRRYLLTCRESGLQLMKKHARWISKLKNRLL